MMPCNLVDRYRCSGKLLPPSSGYDSKPRGKRLSIGCGGSTENWAVMGDIGSKPVGLGMKRQGENSVKKITHPAQDQL